MNLERVFLLIVIVGTLSLIVAEEALENTCKCGVANNRSSPSSMFGKFGDHEPELIVLGNEVTPPYRYPWMAAIIRLGKNACGGALISRDFVITAAHCILRDKYVGHVDAENCYDKANIVGKCFYEAKELEVAFVTNTYDMSKYCKVEQVVVNPSYTVNDYGNDVVLLKLRRAVKCSKMRRPICLPYDARLIKPGTKVTVAGWGIYEPGGRGEKSKKLLQAGMQIISKKRCRRKTMVSLKNKSMVCAIGRRTQGLCFGDSGSPVFLEQDGMYYLKAVVSAIATGNCETNIPSFLTSVPRNMKWISEYVKVEK